MGCRTASEPCARWKSSVKKTTRAESYLCVLECDADAECVDACIELDVDSLAGPLGDLATCIAQNKCLTLDANEEGGSEEAEESEEGENEESSKTTWRRGRRRRGRLYLS